MMNRSILTFVAVYGLLVGATSCGGGGSNAVPPPSGSGGTTDLQGAHRGAVYHQIERLGRPAVKEATQEFHNHDDTNRTAPWQEPLSSQSLYISIGTFVRNVAGRRDDYATTLQSILIPDEMAADLSQHTTTAAYLGVETGGATGSKFGGRALSDDAIDIDLGAIFGKTLSALGLVSDDGRASLCLTTDNVGFNNAVKHTTTTFPYAGTPN
jgi:hypothetical protein